MSLTEYQVGLYGPATESSSQITRYDYSRDGSRRLVLIRPGAGAGALNSGGSGGQTYPLARAIVDNLGLPAMVIDASSDGSAARPDSWGNAASVAQVLTARAWGINGVTYADVAPGGFGPEILVGVSMGASVLLNYAARNLANVRAIVLCVPAVDLDFVYTGGGIGGGGTLAAGMDLAYPTAGAPGTPAVFAVAINSGAGTATSYYLVGVNATGDTPGPVTTVSGGAGGAMNNTVTIPALAGGATSWRLIRVLAGAAPQVISNNAAVGAFNDTNNASLGQYANAWTLNGSNAATSFSPTKNIPAGLKAIPLLYLWSGGDNIVNQAPGAGITPAVVSTYAAAYGANCTTLEVPGAPYHQVAMAAITGPRVDQTTPSLAAIINFVLANL